MSLKNADLKRLRWQYRLLVTALLLLCISGATPLLFWFALWGAYRLGVPMLRTPLRDESHGLPWLAHQFDVPVLYGRSYDHAHEAIWLILLLTAFVFLMLVCGLVVFGSLAILLRWRAGWSSTQAYRFVFYSEVPPSWLKHPSHG